MGLGKISYDEALQIADGFENNSTDLRLHLNDIKSEVDSMDEVLISEGATQLLDTYQGLVTEIDACPTKIEGFGIYLKEAVERYRSDDEQLKQEGK